MLCQLCHSVTGLIVLYLAAKQQKRILEPVTRLITAWYGNYYRIPYGVTPGFSIKFESDIPWK